MEKLKGLWSGGKVNIPGVVYSEDWKPPSNMRREPNSPYREVLPTLDPRLENERNAYKLPTPEELPYTYLERTGALPLAAERVKARQYYMPTTDFSQFEYDDASPEEKRLTAQWAAELYNFNWAVPMGVFMVGSLVAFPFPNNAVRSVIGMSSCVIGLWAEWTRLSFTSARARQNLDDYLLTKEIWYIKNVEVYELEVETMSPAEAKIVQQEVLEFAESAKVQTIKPMGSSGPTYTPDNR